MRNIKLTFSKPKNGWLPVEFYSDQVELSFVSSIIPENPIEQLCENLILALKGLSSKTCWNLEPDQIVFVLEPIGEDVQFSILEKGVKRYSQKGDYKGIVLPIYRSLKKFSTFELYEGDWQAIDPIKLKELNGLVAARKTAHNKL